MLRCIYPLVCKTFFKYYFATKTTSTPGVVLHYTCITFKNMWYNFDMIRGIWMVISILILLVSLFLFKMAFNTYKYTIKEQEKSQKQLEEVDFLLEQLKDQIHESNTSR